MGINSLLNEIEEFFSKNIIDDEEKMYFEEYKKLQGTTDRELDIFEKDFNIKLPEDFKEYYKIKNGSEYPFELFYITFEDSCIPFTIMSIEDIKNTKNIFVNVMNYWKIIMIKKTLKNWTIK